MSVRIVETQNVRIYLLIEARFPQALFIIVDFIDWGRRLFVAIVTGSSRSICP